MIRNRRTIVTAASLSTAVLSAAWAAQPGEKTPCADKMAAMGMPATAEGCAAMKNMCDDMATKQQQADMRLDRLITTMNESSGSTKVDAIAAVINELVTQRAEHRMHMMHMDVAMKDHTIQHVMAAAPADMREKMKKGMDGCSMMKGPASGGH